MHILITADVAHELITDRLRTAENDRRANAFRIDDQFPVSPRRPRFARVRRFRAALAH